MLSYTKLTTREKYALAKNPDTTVETLIGLLDDDTSTRVAEQAIKTGKLPYEQVKRLSKNPSVRIAQAITNSVNPEYTQIWWNMLTDTINSRDWQLKVRKTLAQNVHIPEDMAMFLTGVNSVEVISNLAHNRTSTAKVLGTILRKLSPTGDFRNLNHVNASLHITIAIMNHPNCVPEILDVVKTYPIVQREKIVGEVRNQKGLTLFMDDPDVEVREMLAGNPNITAEQLHELVVTGNDVDQVLFCVIARNSKTSHETLIMLADRLQENSVGFQILAKHRQVTVELVKTIWGKVEEGTQMDLIQNGFLAYEHVLTVFYTTSGQMKSVAEDVLTAKVDMGTIREDFMTLIQTFYPEVEQNMPQEWLEGLLGSLNQYGDPTIPETVSNASYEHEAKYRRNIYRLF